MTRFFALSLFFISLTTMAMPSQPSVITLEEFLNRVQTKNRSIKALEASTEAAGFRYEQTNLELSPVLSLNASYLDDKSLKQPGPGLTLNQTQAREYSVGLAKKFSTGTEASIQTGVVSSNTKMDVGAPVLTELDNKNGFMSFGLSQSLWKDFFGHGTRLRWERESAQQQAEKESYSLQTKQSLVDSESAFWDVVYSEEELNIRKESLERAQKIEGWVRKRVGNGIGDKADLLNAQGLTAARELALINAQDDFIAAQKKVSDILEIPEGQTFPVLKGKLDQIRPMTNYLGSKTGKVVRLDTYLAVLDARAKEVGADEAIDKLRPDLVLEGLYRTNGYDSTLPKAYDRANETDHPTASVALKMTWLLDWETTGAVKNSAKMDALAAKLTKERKLIESETSWSEIQRRHGELTKKIEASDRIAKIQFAKAAAERDKLSKGRSITSQVITAEQDAAEAALILTKLKAEQRKLEAQGRLFVKVEGNL